MEIVIKYCVNLPCRKPRNFQKFQDEDSDRFVCESCGMVEITQKENADESEGNLKG